jgi:hypothetical protein
MITRRPTLEMTWGETAATQRQGNGQAKKESRCFAPRHLKRSRIQARRYAPRIITEKWCAPTWTIQLRSSSRTPRRVARSANFTQRFQQTRRQRFEKRNRRTSFRSKVNNRKSIAMYRQKANNRQIRVIFQRWFYNARPKYFQSEKLRYDVSRSFYFQRCFQKSNS